jgi:hypothetical protein
MCRSCRLCSTTVGTVYLCMHVYEEGTEFQLEVIFKRFYFVFFSTRKSHVIPELESSDAT